MITIIYYHFQKDSLCFSQWDIQQTPHDWKHSFGQWSSNIQSSQHHWLQGRHWALRSQGVKEKPGQTLQVQKQLNISMDF